jgi:hypothetical protein
MRCDAMRRDATRCDAMHAESNLIAQGDADDLTLAKSSDAVVFLCFALLKLNCLRTATQPNMISSSGSGN